MVSANRLFKKRPAANVPRRRSFCLQTKKIGTRKPKKNRKRRPATWRTEARRLGSGDRGDVLGGRGRGRLGSGDRGDVEAEAGGASEAATAATWMTEAGPPSEAATAATWMTEAGRASEAATAGRGGRGRARLGSGDRGDVEAEAGRASEAATAVFSIQ